MSVSHGIISSGGHVSIGNGVVFGNSTGGNTDGGSVPFMTASGGVVVTRGSDGIVSMHSSNGASTTVDGECFEAKDIEFELVAMGKGPGGEIRKTWIVDPQTLTVIVHCSGAQLNVKTSIGNVKVDGQVHGSVSTSSGSVVCENVGGNVKTSSGTVTAHDIGGTVTTSSGHIMYRR